MTNAKITKDIIEEMRQSNCLNAEYQSFQDIYLNSKIQVIRVYWFLPQAQLLIMKVFSDETGVSKTESILAASENSICLGAEVINLSFGSGLRRILRKLMTGG